ncbi:hypothetical protein ACFOSV_00720 [Algoriphagus namhaensis]|uniref:Uncharacterized protein n=1 Tax=Algoriphagus namhaensis TaxID=915353 RepID=A0ABV8ALS3_9BACT
MNFKENMSPRIWNTPEEFRGWIDEIEALYGKLPENSNPNFLLSFVKDQQELDHFFGQMLPFLNSDEVFWLAYPKKSSKKYKTDINRDHGWGELAKEDFEGVRMVSLNEDWSALRFRKVKFIKNMIRKFSLKDQIKPKKDK